MHGRAGEVAEIDRLVRGARAGRSAVLVICGEAGIGKTALLDHATGNADGMTVVRGVGVESEAELPYAGLHLLLRPFLDRIPSLPAPQAAALRAAFGLGEPAGADRFLVGLATLALLAEVAGNGPLLCSVDDAQWLDRATVDALGFAGRRLDAEGIVLIFAARDTGPGGRRLSLPGRAMRLARLDDASASALLADRDPGLTPQTRDRLVAQAGGNPLALIELSGALTTRHPAETVHPSTLVVGAPPGGSPVQDGFGWQIDRLPATTRRMLLLVAADDTGDAGVLLAAAKHLGAKPTDLEPAERADLVQLTDMTLTFRHPLIRSAVYGRSTIGDRIAVHHALAEALDGEEHADRRAWHLASATTGTDDAVAAELESAAERALLRDGHAAGAAALERAARLTRDPATRGRRLAAAAGNAHESGQFDRALALATEAARLNDDPATLARLATIRARSEFESGTPRRSSGLLTEGAARIGGTDPERAGHMLIEAVRMAYYAGSASTMTTAAEAIDAISGRTPDPLCSLLKATASLARLLAGFPADEIPELHRRIDAMRFDELGPPTAGVAPNHAASLQLLTGHAEDAYERSCRIVAAARERGLIGGLPHLLLINTEAALATGRLREALRAAAEGQRIAGETGQGRSAANLSGVAARAAAMTGDDERCVLLAEASMRYATPASPGGNTALAALALCVLDLGRGRYDSAYDRLASLDLRDLREPFVALHTLPVHIEVAARCGHPGQAADLLIGYEQSVERHQGRPIGLAIAQRCRALMSPDEQADHHYQTALWLHHQATGWPLERARTELMYGEWLRRHHSRTRARRQLRSALRIFTDAGASPWADRARSELRATGDTTTRAEEQHARLTCLTPQELQVARLAAAGLTNRDIGARLFLSPRTIGYHLYKIYPKLGIARRADLTRLPFS